MPGLDHGRQLPQVLHAPLGDRIRKLGQPGRARKVHVLDLDVGKPARGVLEQDVDAARKAVLHLAPAARRNL